ncbi:MAG: hypothetical protein FRX48_08700 [Lasallia pustulata]|uniref:Uncharacterized protein n=1 Tax=Lasallia pustulata TaxID=136370 RepID=A0A5M8PDP6_9LECA|nr:MAG: hypothetical protein FRX48_08700 [Lasallia pustulata]
MDLQAALTLVLEPAAPQRLVAEERDVVPDEGAGGHEQGVEDVRGDGRIWSGGAGEGEGGAWGGALFKSWLEQAEDDPSLEL